MAVVDLLSKQSPSGFQDKVSEYGETDFCPNSDIKLHSWLLKIISLLMIVEHTIVLTWVHAQHAFVLP